MSTGSSASNAAHGVGLSVLMLIMIGRCADACSGMRALDNAVGAARPIAATAPDLAHTDELFEVTQEIIGTSRGTGLLQEIGEVTPSTLRWDLDYAFNPAHFRVGDEMSGERVVVQHLSHLGYNDVYMAENLPVSMPYFVSLFPSTDAAFTSVYGRAPTASEAIQMSRFTERIRHDAAVLQRQSLDIPLLFEHFTDSSPFVIFGHSEDNGRVLVMPNGTRVSVAEIHEQCVRRGNHCIVITCHGQDLGIDGAITPEDAYRIWRMARAVSNEQNTVSVAQFSRLMRRARAWQVMQRRIVLSGVGVGGTAGGVYVYYSEAK